MFVFFNFWFFVGVISHTLNLFFPFIFFVLIAGKWRLSECSCGNFRAGEWGTETAHTSCTFFKFCFFCFCFCCFVFIYLVLFSFVSPFVCIVLL